MTLNGLMDRNADQILIEHSLLLIIDNFYSKTIHSRHLNLQLVNIQYNHHPEINSAQS
jgi:hypothetical protein